MILGYNLDCKPASVEFASYTRITADTPVKGSSRLYVGTYLKPGLFWFGSDTIMGGPEGFAPDGEIKRVIRNRNGYVYLDEPFKRTWHGPAVIPIGVPILENVILENGKGPIHVGLAENVSIRYWVVDGYDLPRAISIQSCRNVTLDGVTVSNPSAIGAGHGYAIQIQRCTDFNVEYCEGSGNRHLVTVFASADGEIAHCDHENPPRDCTSLDAHFGVEDVEFHDCDSGGSNFSVGNKWAWGCSVTARRLTNTAMAWVHGTSSLTLEDTALSGPVGLQRNDYGSPVALTLRGVKAGKYGATGHIHFEGGGQFSTRIVLEGMEPQTSPA